MFGQTGCGAAVAEAKEGSSLFTEKGFSKDLSAEEVIRYSSENDKIGNQGLGTEYELYALLTKYDLENKYVAMGFDMDQLDNDEIWLATGMTYNELGIIRNSYEGGYNYGDSIKWIDMNDEGTAMLEDNIFTTRSFAGNNPNTVKAFLYASARGWEYACQHPDEAAEIVAKYGSTISAEHQKYMAEEVKKLVETDTKGNTVTDYGHIDDEALQQTLELSQKYIKLEDPDAADKLSKLTTGDIADRSFIDEVSGSKDGNFGPLEKTDVSIQVKWLPQSQFMGYYVAQDKGFYSDAGLNVEIIPGGGDVNETTAVNSGNVDFGVTWTSTLISADAGGMDLVEVAQIYQRSGLVLMYKSY
ncbi:MAG: ABC transporter substrate-binding protein [Lachnospiraceae bacterium]|nr:ABC transporter substrate-binding protein [Lachnospiraceae bacterium]